MAVRFAAVAAGLLLAVPWAAVPAPVQAQATAPAAASKQAIEAAAALARDVSEQTVADAGPSAGAAPIGATYAQDLPPAIDARLSALALDASQVSVYLHRLDADAPLLAVDADASRVPASVIKLVSTIAGLGMLGSDYRWHTTAYIHGQVRDGHLIGDLIIKGFGDPYLGTEAYAALIRAVRAKGIEHIDGDLIFDDSQIMPAEADRADFDGAPHRSYNALPSALSVNRQVTHVHVYHDRSRRRVGVYTDPPLTAVDIVNEASIVEAPCKGRFHRLRVTVETPPESRPSLRVAGSFAGECPDERIARLVLSPEQHAAAAFDALWRQYGGSIGGRVLLGRRPEQAAPFHEAISRPLGEVIRDINKQSDNLMARMLFLALGIEAAGAPGSTAKSRRALQAWLDENELRLPQLVIDNGSGLSRETRISARGLGELLVWAYRQPFMPELLASLAVVGVDGTLAKRMRHEPIVGKAHLKSGTLRDASCIAGYVLDAEGRRWALVVLVNAIPGQSLQAWRGHAVHHDVLRWVYDGARLPETATAGVQPASAR
ncbi:MAG: D-alanyl-D-alanine carboxypeptidase/D-alanyl-D-alanine-endopeptidase [Thiohalocapsa sp.]|nr:D-alanyl-D-alanine carboxypeptidase/D-alanyl-D-alanine-endopeptidase [Thiohalocapsa sp.]MCF7989276.1 D-alanyl-D-alanine carboxypeptidase/D-alanyl-D-alanine-endopeptidase [Thiohalocapsa sp.]